MSCWRGCSGATATRIRLVYPDGRRSTEPVPRQGINGFFNSTEARGACCDVRKVVPFKRAIAGYQRLGHGRAPRTVADPRAGRAPRNGMRSNGLFKFSPLLDWSEEQIWPYIRARKLPYNACTSRTIRASAARPAPARSCPGEEHRAGRWWWEEAGVARMRPASARTPRAAVAARLTRLRHGGCLMDYLPIFSPVKEPARGRRRRRPWRTQGRVAAECGAQVRVVAPRAWRRHVAVLARARR